MEEKHRDQQHDLGIFYKKMKRQCLVPICCHQVVIEHERKERSNMEAHLRQKMHELLDRQSKVDMQESDFSSR